MKPFQSAFATSPTLLMRMREDPSEADWECFYRTYSPIVRFFAQGRGMRHHEAENIVQETMVILIRKLPDFTYDRSKGKFRGYLSRIVSNMVKKERTREAKRPLRAETWQLNGLPELQKEAMSDEALMDLALKHAALKRVQAYYEERGSNSYEVFHALVFQKVSVTELETRHQTNANNIYQTKDRVKRRLEKTYQSLEIDDVEGLDRLESLDDLDFPEAE